MANPRGYLEWEAIKQIARRPQLLDEPGLTQKSIKVVAPLLPQMPFRHTYKVIFMDREIDEVVTSQRTMISRRGTSGPESAEAQLREELSRHRQMVLAWLQQHPRAKVCVIPHQALLDSPEDCIQKLVDFLGTELLHQPEKMCGAIDHSLFRNRSSNRSRN